MVVDRGLPVGYANQFQRESRILVCTVAAYRGCDIYSGVSNLIRSCARFGIQIHIFGFDQYWHSLYHTKMMSTLFGLLSLQDEYDRVLFMDSVDTIWVRPLDEFAHLADSFSGVIVNAERTCWPDVNLANRYPSCSTDYKYLNSGLFTGKMKDIIDCLNKVRNIGPVYNNDDQGAWTIAYLNGLININLDSNCVLFQSLYGNPESELLFDEDNQLINTMTNTYPSILHAHGPSKTTSLLYQKFK